MMVPAVLRVALLVGSVSAATLPVGPLIIGYQDWGACNATQTLTAVRSGVNVVIWFATNLASVQGEPTITGGPDYACVAAVAAQIAAENLETAHLISIGGWDAPHPKTTWDGATWFATWDAWNRGLPRPFDGVDWDLEGNDAANATSNHFTPACVDLVVATSEAAKAAGYVVSMVPPQSYFDVTTSAFNLSLRNAYPDFHPDFRYHGMNVYASMFSKAAPGTFDIVIVQLYESWSRADAALLAGGVPGDVYLRSWARAVLAGYDVDFPEGRRTVAVKPTQLVVGLSSGDKDGKSAFFWPSACAAAYAAAPPSERPRGYAFWNINLEGTNANGTTAKLSFAPELDAFLHVRS